MQDLAKVNEIPFTLQLTLATSGLLSLIQTP